ncbi:hypothetical protein [Vibrio cholerae]|uniref:hypothetical protein n=1 Tax=Vibrio cholerae TaxID=666 RepID=UPI001652A89F|nr:hypothetical protein [Vibrio cholerae]GIC20792.1 transposase [Vibrio cholerae]
MERQQVETTADKVKQIFIQNPKITDIIDDISDCREFSDGIHEPVICTSKTGHLAKRHIAVQS